MPLINHCGGGGVDASGVTADASQILEGVTVVDAEGNPLVGTMPDNGAVTLSLDTTTTSKTISKGYHNGEGKAQISLETKSVTPTTTEQTITPTSGKVLSKVTVGAMPTATQATPSISVSTSGLITAKATQSEGYVQSGTKSATKQLTTKSAATITPSTSNQTISSGTYLTGAQTILGDSDLKPENIKSGISIFGVDGELGGVDRRSFNHSSNFSSTPIVLEDVPSKPTVLMLTCVTAGAGACLKDLYYMNTSANADFCTVLNPAGAIIGYGNYIPFSYDSNNHTITITQSSIAQSGVYNIESGTYYVTIGY